MVCIGALRLLCGESRVEAERRTGQVAWVWWWKAARLYAVSLAPSLAAPRRSPAPTPSPRLPLFRRIETNLAIRTFPAPPATGSDWSRLRNRISIRVRLGLFGGRETAASFVRVGWETVESGGIFDECFLFSTCREEIWRYLWKSRCSNFEVDYRRFGARDWCTVCRYGASRDCGSDELMEDEEANIFWSIILVFISGWISLAWRGFLDTFL